MAGFSEVPVRLVTYQYAAKFWYQAAAKFCVSAAVCQPTIHTLNMCKVLLFPEQMLLFGRAALLGIPVVTMLRTLFDVCIMDLLDVFTTCPLYDAVDVIQKRCLLQTCTPSECEMDGAAATGDLALTQKKEKQDNRPIKKNKLLSDLRNVFVPRDGGLPELFRTAFVTWLQFLPYSICAMAFQNTFLPVQYHNLFLSIYGILFNMYLTLQVRKKNEAAAAAAAEKPASSVDVEKQQAAADVPAPTTA